jgi:hypothetical protein
METRASQAAPLSELTFSHASAPTWCERRRPWARLVAKMFEADPLRGPCGGTMRLMAFTLDPAVIRTILQYRPWPEPRAHAPSLG